MPTARRRESSLPRRAIARQDSARRRDSLPSSCGSSTVATENKARHRQEVRRQSIVEFKAQAKKQRLSGLRKENDPPRLPYSPPLTRSGKKKALSIATKPRLSGSVLTYSPPNQEENSRREKEENSRKESARKKRVTISRKSGNLLVYSPTNRPIDGQDVGFCNDDDDDKTVDTVMASEDSKSLDSSYQVAKSADNHVEKKLQEMMEQMKEFMCANNSVDATLQMQLQRTEELLTEKLRLHEEKAQLEEKVQKNASSFREKLSSVQAELDNCKQQLEEAELLNKKLDDQNRNLTSVGETELAQAAAENDRMRAEMLRLERGMKEMSMQTSEYEHIINKQNIAFEELKETLTAENRRLDENFVALQQEKSNMEADFLQAQHNFERGEKRLNEVEAQWRRHLQEKEGELATVVAKLADTQDRVSHLARENNDLRKKLENNQEQLLTRDKNLANERTAKDQKIGDLFKQLGEKQAEMDVWRTKNSNLANDVQQLQQQVSDAQSNYNDVKTLNSKMTKSMKDLESDLQHSKRELDEAIEQLEERDAHSDSLEKKIIELSQLLAEANDLCEEYKDSARNSDDEMHDLVETLNSDKAKYEQELSDTKANLAVAKREMRKANEKIAELEEFLRAVESERDNAKESMSGFFQREDTLMKKLFSAECVRRAMHAKLIQLLGNIRVFVRVRPLLRGEGSDHGDRGTDENTSPGEKRKRDNAQEISSPFSFPYHYDDDNSTDMSKNRIEIREPKKDRGGLKERRKTWNFAFDGVFPPSSRQSQVWEATEPLIQCAVDGFNVTIFAYGQTGSGKTYTMLGEPGNEGIIARSVDKLFNAKEEIEALSRSDMEVEISVELLEIYNEKVRDLLGAENDKFLRVTSQEVSGNVVAETTSREQVLTILEHAQSRRCVKETLSNAESSRSHLIFTIHFHVKAQDGSIRKGKLNICDLAGSERLSKSGVHNKGGSLLKETQHINKSLSTLSTVIERLQAGEMNAPFRESKLTLLLKDSLSGNSKTLAIVCCNPLGAHLNESLSSLRFAAKVNRVDLKAATNFSC